MKTIIAGSRGIIDIQEVYLAVEQSGFEITEVISGTARGVDRLGEEWAKNNDIPVRRFPADWNRYGKAAGYRRNAEMAEYADAAVILWDGESKGTKHMIDLAERAGIRYYVHPCSATA